MLFNVEFTRVKISIQVQILKVDLNKISFGIQCTKSNLGTYWVQDLRGFKFYFKN